jgi:dolichyl-phosphate beta-glucosyltransferase
MNAARETVIVVPCYNEAARLPLAAFRAFAHDTPDVGFVFVDDGSTDDTRRVLRQLAAECADGVRVIELAANRGKAEAVRLGMIAALASGARWAGYWDADLATPLDAIVELRDVLEHNHAVDVVFGSRVQLLGRTIERRALRHYVGRVFATVVSLLTRLPVYDSQCGAKMFRNTAVTRALFEAPFVSRWLFDAELLLRLPDASRVVEHPLRQWRDVAGTKIRLTDVVALPFALVRLYVAYPRKQ